MKEIKLTQGKVSLVDDDDFEYLNQFKWYARKCTNTYYAVRNIRIDGKCSVYRMHWDILKIKLIDHKDQIIKNGDRQLYYPESNII